MTNKQMREWLENNCTYLALYNLEGELVDYFLNVSGINDLYKKRHKEILEAETSNIIMVFRECDVSSLTGAIFSSAIDKTSLVIYKPSEFVENHPEVFMVDDE